MPKEAVGLTDPRRPTYRTTGSITATEPSARRKAIWISPEIARGTGPPCENPLASRRAVATSDAKSWLGKAEPTRRRSICKPSLPNDRLDHCYRAVCPPEGDLYLA